MIDRSKHSEEHKADNKKVVTIGGKKKLLLFDNEVDGDSEQISETELEEAIKALVADALNEITDELDADKPLYEAWLDEAEYPEGFNIETFKSLPSFRKRVAYAQEHLGKLGRGSARIVFAVDADTVVKIALNKKGQAQNEVEADVSNIGYEHIAHVKDYDNENHLYIEAERATKMKKSDWKRITGTDFDLWMNVLRNYGFKMTRRGWGGYVVPPNMEEIEESELFSDLVTMMGDFGMPPGDIGRINSWGLVRRNGVEIPVLVDYGLTEKVFNDFYGGRL